MSDGNRPASRTRIIFQAKTVTETFLQKQRQYFRPQGPLISLCRPPKKGGDTYMDHMLTPTRAATSEKNSKGRSGNESHFSIFSEICLISTVSANKGIHCTPLGQRILTDQGQDVLWKGEITFQGRKDPTKGPHNHNGSLRCCRHPRKKHRKHNKKVRRPLGLTGEKTDSL